MVSDRGQTRLNADTELPSSSEIFLERYGTGLRRLGRNLAWLGTGEVLVKAGLLIIAVLVARGMGTEGMGVFTVASAGSILAITLISFGQVELLIRDSARAPEDAAQLLAASRRFRFRVLLLTLPILLVTVALVSDPILQAGLLAFLPYVVLRVEVMTATAVFKGRDQMDVEVRARSLEIGLALLIVILLVLFDAPPWTTGLALSLGAAAAAVWLWPRLRTLADGTESDRSGPAPRELARQGATFLGVSLTLQFLYRHDTMLMAAFGLSNDEIGVYGSAVVPTLGLLAIPQLVAYAVYPTFSRRAAAGRRPAMTGTLAALAGLGAGTACAVAVSILRRPFILWLGTEYLGAVDLLGWLAWILPGLGVTLLTSVVHAAWNQQGRLFWAMLTAFVAAFVLNLWQIPAAGALGAARVAVGVHSVLGLSLWLLTLSPSQSNAQSNSQVPKEGA